MARKQRCQSIFSRNKDFFRKSPIAGFPDLAGILPTGQFWALELKTKKGVVSSEQRAWIASIRRSNGIAEVVRSPEEVTAFIEKMKA